MAVIAKRHELDIRPENLERFKARIPVGAEDECWLWEGVRVKDGYGYIKQHSPRVNGKRKAITIFAHRLSYQIHKGEIPLGSVIDHTCHDPKVCTVPSQCLHRICLNPNHLMAVSPKENTLRGSFRNEVKGMCNNMLHPWIEENKKVWSSGKTVCLPCHKETMFRNRRKAGK